MFQRKERKFVLILAGEASAAFSLAIGQRASFDCRLCLMPAAENVIDYRWRTEDARRNALSAYCYWTLRAKGALPSEVDCRLAGLSVEEKRDLLRQRGIDLEAQDDWKRGGSFLRREQYEHSGRDPVVGKDVATFRRRITQLPLPRDGDDLAAIVARAIAQMEDCAAS